MEPNLYQVTLPWPPSNNHRHTVARGARRITTTKAARVYLANAGWAALTQRGAGRDALEGEVAVEANVYPPPGAYDWDNWTKALDACNGVLWGDDGQIREAHVYVHAPSAQPRVELVVCRREFAGVVLCRNASAVAAGAICDVMDLVANEGE